MRFSWTPFEIVPSATKQEEVRVPLEWIASCGLGSTDKQDEKVTKDEGEETPDYGGSGSDDPGKPPEDEGPTDRGDDEGDSPQEEGPWNASTLEEYMERRCFVFVHHYAGKDDPLSAAIVKAAKARGVIVKVYSIEKESGSGDLLEDQPYRQHLRWAEAGHIDGYHAGFPCSTFSVLRFREAPGMPPPVRTKAEPYGKSTNSPALQRQCDEGTIMACRSIDIATLVAKRPTRSKVLAVATLENPPPSNKQDHLSAWELPEMQKFVNIFGSDKFKAAFNTCQYEPELEIGKKHYKPQLFAGTLFDIETMARTCKCGSPKNHEAIVGYEKSKASAAYPAELCKTYAKLLLDQFVLMGKAEFLCQRMENLSKEVVERKQNLRPEVLAAQEPTMRPTEHINEPYSIDRVQAREGEGARGSGSRKKRKAEPDPEQPSSSKDERQGVKREGPELSWQGGEGKYETFKKSKAKRENPKYQIYWGGLRDPYGVTQQMSNMLAVGLRVRAAWEAMVRKNPGAIRAAETYGTKDCELDDKHVMEWRAQLRRVLGARAPPSIRMKPKWCYTSPLQGELIKAWCDRGNDPKWIDEGAPLGIEMEIGTCGIFPPVDSDDEDEQGTKAFEDAITQLSHGDITNYSSVTDNPDDARVELDRYKEEGYLKVVSKKDVEKELGHGTISRLGLIVKEKPEGKKRRIIIDLRRSDGNNKSHLPERLVLPRPLDAVEAIKGVHAAANKYADQEDVVRELVVIDISDAFMMLGLHQKELAHTVTPSLDSSEEFYIFPALLFGYRTAPLLWSRTAALLCRLLQSLVAGHEGRHVTYLDDSIWVLQGDLQTRNLVLSMILYTMAALGFKVSIKKGERAPQVVWIGVQFNLHHDAVVLTLPDKFMKELVRLLKSWEGKGMASLKDLRKAAGKMAWLSGILTRTRWTVSNFYAVLHAKLKDVQTGAEESRRSHRKDQRPKEHLFAVKQLDQARIWLVAYLTAAMGRPSRKFNLTEQKSTRASLLTDASPEGLGAILLINNQAIRAYSSPVTKADAEIFGFTLGDSTGQGILEALAILVAIKLWRNELGACRVEVQVQSDSMVALALSQKLSNSNPSLNFIGAEIAIACEESGIERLRPTHVPGAANIGPDYLSRPSKWEKEERPPHLKGLKVQTPPERDAGYFTMPLPNTAGSLWTSSQASDNAWSSLKG